MTRRQETGMVLIVFVVLLAILFLTSCNTKKTITEYVVTHDTLVVHHTDTIRDVRYVTRSDTIRELVTREIVIREDTAHIIDTIRINTFSDRYRYVYVGDSAHKYQAVVDSLKAVVMKDNQKSVTKTTKPRYWEFGVFALFIVAVIILGWKIR